MSMVRPSPHAAVSAAVLFALLLLYTTAPAAANAAAAEAQDEATRQLLAAGDKALGSGRHHYREALAKYTEALVRSPQSTRGLYSRARLLVSMGEGRDALADVDALLAVAPTHVQGLSLRMELSLQGGHLQGALTDGRRLAEVHRAAGRSAKAAEMAATLAQLEVHWATWQSLSSVMDVPLSAHTPAGADGELRQRYEGCVRLLQQVIQQFASDSVELRLRRASCAQAAGDSPVVTHEVKYVLARDAQNVVAIELNARALRGLGALDQARSEARRCLSVDPEYAPCARVAKLIRAQQRRVEVVTSSLAEKKFERAVEEIDAAYAEEGGHPPYAEQLAQWRCEAYTGLRDIAKGIPACEVVVTLTGADSQAGVDAQLRIAELHMVDDNLDRAEEVGNRLRQAHPANGKVGELLQRIQQLRRAGARKDYYKILGVKKSASASDIRRAYRKLAKTLHPDQLRSKDMSDAERERSDKRFRDMNEAKEVLLDDEKRARYDNGEDVMNPQAQHQQQPFYGHPFHFAGGGFPGGGFPGGGFPGGGFPGGGFGGGGGQQFFFFRQ